MTHSLELLQVVHHHTAAEEGAAVFEGQLVDDDFGAFGLDALHHAQDAALAEVVAVRLHRAVAVHYRLNQVLRIVRAVRKELLRVLLETVAAIVCVGYSNADTFHIQQLTYSCTYCHNISGNRPK